MGMGMPGMPMDITTALQAPFSGWENFPPNREPKYLGETGVSATFVMPTVCTFATFGLQSGIRQEVVICYSSHRAAIWIEIEESKESSHPQPVLFFVTMSIMRILLLALVCACEAQLFELEDFKASFFIGTNGSRKTSILGIHGRSWAGKWEGGTDLSLDSSLGFLSWMLRMPYPSISCLASF